MFKHRLQVTSYSSQPVDIIPPPSLSHYGVIACHIPKLSWFSHHIEHSPSTSSLLHHIVNGSALGVSDGSFYPDVRLGACAWIVASPDGLEYILGEE